MPGMMETWTVEVPGTFDSERAFLDIETAKTPCDYRMTNGETLRNRWAVAFAGVASRGEISLMAPRKLDDPLFLESLGFLLANATEVVYGATREFDEMICKGRFTNARRAHEPVPFFPSVLGADRIKWTNVGGTHDPILTGLRGADCPSRDVPALLGYAPVGGGKKLPVDADRVMVHLLRDVVELVLTDGRPDAACRAWCKRVLSSYSFAVIVLFGPES